MKLLCLFLLPVMLFGAQQSSRVGGIEVGQTIPQFRLKGQDGAIYDFDRLKGPNGLALLFYRSADWCPYCKTQLVQLQESLDRYKAQGLGVAAISYDSVEILQTFAGRTGIRYPLLSDPDSAVIRAFGILNTQVPQTSPQYGIPNPGMYIVAPSGRVTSKYFEDAYQERFTPDTILTREFGAGGVRETEVRTEHLQLTFKQTQAKVATGNRVTLIADFKMPEKMHVYAPGATGYRPVALTIEENPDLKLHPAEFPKSEILFLPAINERVPVYHGSVRITRDVTFTRVAAGPNIELKGTLEYQACDDKICYVPKRVPVTFLFETQAFDRTRAPENLQRKAPGTN